MSKGPDALYEALEVFLGSPLNEEHALQHIGTVTEFVKAYTRSNGFAENGYVNDDLAAVIITATSRLLHNPSLVVRKEIGQTLSLLYTPFNGFTVAELMVLNRYRQRTA